MDEQKTTQAKILDSISDILKEGGKTYELIPEIVDALAKDPAFKSFVRDHFGSPFIINKDDINEEDLNLEELPEGEWVAIPEEELSFDILECPKDGVGIIAEERKRVKEEEGFHAYHDDAHEDGELANAGAVYAMTPKARDHCDDPYVCPTPYELLWPFSEEWYKPSIDELGKPVDDKNKIDGRIKELAKAGQFIAAEIDRLQRLKEREYTDEEDSTE